MPKFKLGTRVQIVSTHRNGTTSGLNNGLKIGSQGTVCEEDDIHEGTDERPGVCWDIGFPTAHSCNNHCTEKHGWYVYSDELEFVLPDVPASPIPEELSLLYATTEPSIERPRGAAQKRKTTATRL